MIADIEVASDGWLSLDFTPAASIDAAMAAIAGRVELPEPLDPDATGIAVLLTSDAAVQVLNRDFRGKDKPTNVLSFAALDDPDWRDQLTQDEDFHLGDIAFALETLEREAAEQEKTLQDHFTHLVIHGILHLLGYDHEEDDEAEEMETLETEILESLGINDPYESR